MSQLLSQYLSASQIAAVEAALQQTFGSQSISDISLLAGGLSASPVFKIIVQDQPYVLKLGQYAAGQPVHLELAANAGIAPRMYYQDAATGISISGFIDNKPVRAVFPPEKLAQELAAAIRTVHNITYSGAGKELRETIDALIGGFKERNMLSGPLLDECFSNYALVREQYPWQDPVKVFSHNDLNPTNILCDGERLWIIDWDTSYLNDPYVDLANAANFFIHTDEQETIFLQTYFGQPANEQQQARFYIMRQVGRIIYAMLMFQLAAQAKPADHAHNQEMEGITVREFGALMGAGKISLATYEGQLMYGKALLNEAVHRMRAPRFAASLATIS